MKTNTNDGGPAFPKPLDPYPNMQAAESGTPGMSLRDYLAAHAPAPTPSEIEIEQSFDRSRNPHNDNHRPRIRERHEIVADLLYRHADAMLAARQKGS